MSDYRTQNERDAPEELWNTVSGLCSDFYLDGWRMRVRVASVLKTPDGDDADGYTELNHDYLRVTFIFHEDVDPKSEDGRHVILHEVLHLAQQPADLAMWHVLSMLPEHIRDAARGIWDTACEQTTERLTRAIEKAYPWDDGKGASEGATHQGQEGQKQEIDPEEHQPTD